MTYFEEAVGRRVAALPHTDEYFADEEADAPGLPEILLAMHSLTERQRFVIECRFGLRRGMGGEVVTHREIAELLGIHHSTVQGIEAAGLARLRWVLRNPAP